MGSVPTAIETKWQETIVPFQAGGQEDGSIGQSKGLSLVMLIHAKLFANMRGLLRDADNAADHLLIQSVSDRRPGDASTTYAFCGFSCSLS
jgi:hypothetical protein